MHQGRGYPCPGVGQRSSPLPLQVANPRGNLHPHRRCQQQGEHDHTRFRQLVARNDKPQERSQHAQKQDGSHGADRYISFLSHVIPFPQRGRDEQAAALSTTWAEMMKESPWRGDLGIAR